MTVLLGVAALAVDASFAFDLRNRLAAVADAAAKSAALEVNRGNSANITAFAQAEVNRHAAMGLIPSGLTPDAHLCTAAGATCVAPYNTARYVEVFLASTQSSFFARVLGVTVLTPRARAVAGSAEAVDCWVIFEDLTSNNNDTITMNGCGVSVGDDISLGNGSWIHAPSVGVGDQCCGSGTVSPAQVRITMPPDPLASLPAPADPGPACSSPLMIVGNMTLNPGHYCGWRFNDNGNTLTLNPGTYYITGPIDARSSGKDANIVGSGVMIYLAPGGYIDLDANHVSMNLSAPTSGTYSGILFYQDRTNNHAADFAKNNGDFTFSGASYFPAADVTVKNNLGWASNCTLFVAKKLTTKNNATVNNDCSAFAGGTPWKSVALAW
jgi:acetyltransferase-like isoleucine patch superfamily enzyme